MAYYISVDCGTTNSRAYVIDQTGKIFGKARKKVGVRDTAVTGSRDVLLSGVKEIIRQAVLDAGLTEKDIQGIFSSGMITSEIGLCELEHLEAPCDVDKLAQNVVPIKELKLTQLDIPVYFVRGIKNPMKKNSHEDPFVLVGSADFMRGEETQMVGLMAEYPEKYPVMVVVLSSHTKFIPIDKNGQIRGSLTTISGQAYEAILAKTFVGKSVEKRDSQEECPKDYFDENVIRQAVCWNQKVGILRTLMYPRFLEVLLDTKWYERDLFFQALLAAEDMKALGQLESISNEAPTEFVLIGQEERCKLYGFVLKQIFEKARITTIADEAQVDSLCIQGILKIMESAGVI